MSGEGVTTSSTADTAPTPVTTSTAPVGALSDEHARIVADAVAALTTLRSDFDKLEQYLVTRAGLPAHWRTL